jgi:hypothetical protein
VRVIGVSWRGRLTALHLREHSTGAAYWPQGIAASMFGVALGVLLLLSLVS